MTEKKKREKVVAEITAAHLTELAAEYGRSLNQEEAITFLNQEGHAYEMWKQMMRAGEEYLRSALRSPSRLSLAAVPTPPSRPVYSCD